MQQLFLALFSDGGVGGIWAKCKGGLAGVDPRAHSQTVSERGSTSRARCNQGPRDDAISEFALEDSDEEAPMEGPVVVGRGCGSDQGRRRP